MKLWISLCLMAWLPLCSAATKPDKPAPVATAAAAAPDAGPGEFKPQPNACKSEVAKFEETLGFIRQHQGVAAAAAIKEKLIPAKLEAELLATKGYCGLAAYIREQKLNR